MNLHNCYIHFKEESLNHLFWYILCMHIAFTVNKYEIQCWLFSLTNFFRAERVNSIH